MAVTVAGAVLGAALLLLPLGTALATQRALAGTADATALAAADARVGIVAGAACELAARVAAAGGAQLEDCHTDGLVVTVTVTSPLGGVLSGLTATATATAGPPSPASD